MGRTEETLVLRTVQPTAGEDERGYYLLAPFYNKFSDEVEEMLQLHGDPDVSTEIVERNDTRVVLKIRPDLQGLGTVRAVFDFQGFITPRGK